MSNKSLPAQVAELWELVRAYAKQETVDQLKGIGRFVAFGVAGSLFIGIGLALLALSTLRALQTETNGALDNNLSWVPYLGVLVACLVLIGLLATQMTKGKDRRERHH